ncbi:MAG: hypothetical protein AAFQ65_11335 [Myxococcota bacterium]
MVIDNLRRIAAATFLGASGFLLPGCFDLEGVPDRPPDMDDGDDDGGDGTVEPEPEPRIEFTSVNLEIQAGTQIYGAVGEESSLVLTRGSTIDVNGTEGLPVIMAAVTLSDDGTIDDPDVGDLSGRGEWGGLVISGQGIANTGSLDNPSAATAAGAPRFFGGDNNSEDSGSLRFTIIAEAGLEYDGGGRASGLALETVGSGTEIDFVQVVGSDGDCTTILGGAVSVAHLVCVGAAEDSIEIGLGYQGDIQFALIRQGTTSGRRGIESSNNDMDIEATPLTAPNIANVLVLGNSGDAAASDSIGAVHRQGFAGRVYQSVFTDDTLATGSFEGGCVDIDQPVAEGLRHFDSVFNCTGGRDTGIADPDDDASEVGSYQQEALDSGALNDADAAAIMVSAATLAVSGIDPAIPTSNLPDSLDAAPYYGAVNPDGSDNWWQDWTAVNSDYDGNLPGSNLHPLEDEITRGNVVPAEENRCTTINPSFRDGGSVDVFGVMFPVCIIDQDIEQSTQMPRDHVYVLRGTINVGDGDQDGRIVEEE